jgi:GntR family transcriptional regulator
MITKPASANSRSLAREGGVSLYAQIRERLRNETMQMTPGSAILPEVELEQNFGVSRITVRRAIDDLVQEGILVRKQGKGTFVQSPKLTHELNAVTSWTEQLRMLGFTAQTADLQIREVEASPALAKELRISRGDALCMVMRLRLANGEPMSLMTNYLPASLVPELARKFVKGESLYDLLNKVYGLVPDVAIDKVETRLPTREEAKRLMIPARTPVLCVNRISYLTEGTPLEKSVVISRGDRYQYQVSLRGRARVPSSFPALHSRS